MNVQAEARSSAANVSSPDCPCIRGTAQNPDVYFQARESANPFYFACPAIVQSAMDRFAAIAARQYHLFDGWAYHIGFGGLDHVLASGRNVVRTTLSRRKKLTSIRRR